MYNLPEMRAVNARFWQALRGLLAEAGLRDLPESLTFDLVPVPERIGPEVVFSQTCGYPLETIFCGRRTHSLRAVRRACRVTSTGIARSTRWGFPLQQPSFQSRDEPAAARFGRHRRWPSILREGH